MEQTQVLISTFEYAYSQSLGIEGAKKIIEKAVREAGLIYKDVLSHDEALKVYEQLKNEKGFIRSIATCLTILLTPEVQALIVKIKELEENIVERIRAEDALRLIQNELERRVEERTIDLNKVNQQLMLEINERNQIETALRRSEERFRIAAKNASDFIYDWDIETGTLTWFGNVDKNLGYESGEFPRTIEAWEKAIHPEDRKTVVTLLESHVNEQKPYEVNYRLIRKDGELVYWTDRGIAIRNEHGKAVKMYGACTDVTTTKKAEIALQESKQRLSDIIDFLPDATFVIDTKGKIISWNKAIEEMTGVKAQDMIGKGNYEHSVLFYGDRKPILIDLTMDPDGEKKKNYSFFHKERNSLTAESFIPNFRGKEVYLRGKASPLYDKNNNIVGSIETIRDITLEKQKQLELDSTYKELVKTQAQLLQSAKMASLGQLAGGIAHEVNNPLSGVMNNVQILKLMLESKKTVDYNQLSEICSVIEASSLRCKSIIKSLLDFSHASRGIFQPVQLNIILSKVLGLVGKEMELDNITIQKEYQPVLPDIQGDPQLLQQVVMGLLVNAKWAIDKRQDKSARIIILHTWSKPDENSVYLSISDNGIGIPQENLPHIFEPFFTTKDVGEGTGLGLALIYKIIENHNGTIKFESLAGTGTTFTISFPARM